MKHTTIGDSAITPHEACQQANAHLVATSNRRDVHWVVRNGRVVIEFRDPPCPSFGLRAP